MGAVGLLAATLSDQPPLGALTLTAFPIVTLGFGLRGRLVAARIRQLTDTPEEQR